VKSGVDHGDMIRLRREITIMRKISHPNIVALYKVIETDSVVALVLEFMPGKKNNNNNNNLFFCFVLFCCKKKQNKIN
jgi:serine/threonine protein kinase